MNYPRGDKLFGLAPTIKEEQLPNGMRIELLVNSGRLAHADVSDEFKNPIIIPFPSHLVKLLVEDLHKRVLVSPNDGKMHEVHIQQSVVSRDFRSRFAASNVANLIRKACNQNCLQCFMENWGKNMMQYLQGQLPRIRVTPAPPFTFIAMDHFGPIR